MLDYNVMLTHALPPITLISGIGLLLLAMTARYNHSTNRVRQLIRERNSVAPCIDRDLEAEIEYVFQRALMLKMSILCIVLSASFSGLQVLTTVLECFFNTDLMNLKMFFLLLSCGFVIASTVYFVREVWLSTRAISMSVNKQ